MKILLAVIVAFGVSLTASETQAQARVGSDGRALDYRLDAPGLSNPIQNRLGSSHRYPFGDNLGGIRHDTRLDDLRIDGSFGPLPDFLGRDPRFDRDAYSGWDLQRDRYQRLDRYENEWQRRQGARIQYPYMQPDSAYRLDYRIEGRVDGRLYQDARLDGRIHSYERILPDRHLQNQLRHERELLKQKQEDERLERLERLMNLWETPEYQERLLDHYGSKEAVMKRFDEYAKKGR